MPRKASSGVHSRGVGDVGRPWTVQERRAIYDAVVEFGENEWNLVRVGPRLASLLRVVSLWSYCGRHPPNARWARPGCCQYVAVRPHG